MDILQKVFLYFLSLVVVAIFGYSIYELVLLFESPETLILSLIFSAIFILLYKEMKK
jgi:hypothetical protein